MSDEKATTRGFAMSALGLVIAVIVLFVLWRVLRLAIGVALGIVLAIAALAGLAYLGFRSVTSGR